MPKRIMSKSKSQRKTDRSNDKSPSVVAHSPDAKDIIEEAKGKGIKDRSALVGLKRTRKSRDQIYQLQKLYEDSKGKPTKQQLKNLAKESGLKLQQVYKWYWDTEKKNNKLKSVLEKDERNIRSPQRISRKIMKTQYTDEFGGYSKTWFADGLDQVKNSEQLFEQPIEEEAYIQSQEPAGKDQNQDYGMDCLARNLGLNIEALARELAMNNDGRKPIQCLDVDDDAHDLRNQDQSMEDEVLKGQLLKMQKVDESKNEDSKEQEEVSHEKEKSKKGSQNKTGSSADFVKHSRQTSYQSCKSGDANMVDDNCLLKPPSQKLTPMHPMKDITHNVFQKGSIVNTRGKAIFNSSIRQKNESPIIMPNVIRPTQGQMAKSGGTPQSVLSRASYASPYNNQQVIGKNTKFAPVGVINSGRIFHNKAQ